MIRNDSNQDILLSTHGNSHHGNIQYDGFLVDMVQKMADMIGFDFVLAPTETDMVGNLTRGVCTKTNKQIHKLIMIVNDNEVAGEEHSERGVHSDE